MWQLWLLKYVNDGWKSTEDLRNYIFFHYFVTYLYYNMFVVFVCKQDQCRGHYSWWYNVFYTQLGDFGLARWKTTDDPVQTKILGTLGYNLYQISTSQVLAY